MGKKSKIGWTESTWNPVTGCTKVSAGCKNCYAERMSRRLQSMGQENYANGFDVTLQHHMLFHPLKWKRPRLIFVNSMSDLFHEDVPDSYVEKVFDVMRRAYWHRFQVLTKRDKRLIDLSSKLMWTRNIWMGVTVENVDCLKRVDSLRVSGACVKFISFEPLLGPMPEINLSGIDWVIVGGESGPGARPMEKRWVVDIRDQCVANDVACWSID